MAFDKLKDLWPQLSLKGAATVFIAVLLFVLFIKVQISFPAVFNVEEPTSVAVEYQVAFLKFEVPSDFVLPVLHSEVIVSELRTDTRFKRVFLSTGTDDSEFLSTWTDIEIPNNPRLLFRSRYELDQKYINTYEIRFPAFFEQHFYLVEQEDDSRTHKVTLTVREEYKSLQESLLDPKTNSTLSFVKGEELVFSFFLSSRSKSNIRTKSADYRNLFKGWFSASSDECQNIPEEALSSCHYKSQMAEESPYSYDYNYVASHELEKCSGMPFRRNDLGHPVLTPDSQNKVVELHIIGDSQPERECQQLQQYLMSPNASMPVPLFLHPQKHNSQPFVSVTCGRINGDVTTDPEYYAGMIGSRIKNTFKNSLPEAKRVVLINFSGLWQTAYGKFENGIYHRILDDLLQFLLEQKELFSIDEVFYMSTTIVSPRVYEKLHRDKHKFAMMQTRVEYANLITKNLIQNKYQDDIKFLDTGDLSWVGEQDPETPNDMRHLGRHTNLKILKFILCNVFKDYLF